MVQLRLWEEEPSQEAKDKVNQMFVDYWNRKRKIRRIVNCLFWFLLFVVFTVLCGVLLYAWQQVI